MLQARIGFILVFAILSCPFMQAQEFVQPHLGVSAGLTAALGTKMDRLGFFLRGYYLDGNLQINADIRVYENFKNLGPKGIYTEGAVAIGLVYGFGKKDSLDKNPFLSPVSNQTTCPGSIGYSYNLYINRIGTTQSTGTISLEYNKINFQGEDDLFSHPAVDRYRTGAILVQYNYNNQTVIGLNTTLWTGKLGQHIINETYPYANGYLDTSNAKFGLLSHGLLSLQAKTILPVLNGDADQDLYGKEAQVNVGIDAEQVRNAIQNRFVHDMIFLPGPWRNKANADFPMIDSEGQQFLYKPGQKIRKPTLYLNGFLNPLPFY